MYYGISVNDEKEKLTKYLEQVNKKNKLLFGRSSEVFKKIFEYMNRYHNYYDNSRHQSVRDLINSLWKEDTKDIAECMASSELKAIKAFLGDEGAQEFKKIWDRCSLYIYSSGMGRRSYRSKKNTSLYLSGNIEKLAASIVLTSQGFTLDSYLQGTFTSNSIWVVSDIIALRIDEGDAEVLDKIRDIIYGDNNAALLSREIIKGLLMSRSSAAHKMVGDLLLAAKLQEGLRQVIAECMDEGSVEGFIYLVKLIIDNNLERFSSIVRALDVWAGLGIASEKPKTIKKCLELGYKALTDEDFSNICMESDDNLYLYMGLWSKAVREVEDTPSYLESMLASDKKYKKLTALYFLTQIQDSVTQLSMAHKNLQGDDLEVLSWVCMNIYSGIGRGDILHEDGPFCFIKDPNGQKNLFFGLKRIVDLMPKKAILFEKSVFPWINVDFTINSVLTKMIYAVGQVADDEIIDTLIDYSDKMEADTRALFIKKYLQKPSNPKQKTAMLNFLGDKGALARKEAQLIIGNMNLSKDDYLLIEDLLQYKAGDLRKSSIKLLLDQSPEQLLATIERLLGDKSELKRLAGLDIVNHIEHDGKFSKIHKKAMALVAELSSQTTKEKVLTDRLMSDNTEKYTASNGYGLFDPAIKAEIPAVVKDKDFSLKKIFRIPDGDMNKLLKGLEDLIFKHRDYEYEYENYDGSMAKVVLGGEYGLRARAFKKGYNSGYTLDDYPLTDIWRSFIRENSLSAENLIELDFFFLSNTQMRYIENLEPWFINLVEEIYPLKRYKEFMSTITKLKFYSHMHTIIKAAISEIPSADAFGSYKSAALSVFESIPEDKYGRDYAKKAKGYYYSSCLNSTCVIDHPIIKYWRDAMKFSICDDRMFEDYFHICYTYYRASDFKSVMCLNLDDFSKALGLGLIDQNEVFRELTVRAKSPDNIQHLTNRNNHRGSNPSALSELQEIRRKVVDRILDIELKRGDMSTDVSSLAMKIVTCKGIRHFVNILKGTGDDPFIRGYVYMWGDSNKKEMFSHLLKGCYPDEGDDAGRLRELIRGERITEKRLLEAAMYSPQWIDIVEEYLNWPGLRATCWYFQAHVNEMFSEDKQTVITRYSPISPLAFKDGAFDINWFWDAYRAIGEKRFRIVYGCAKYISGGGNHRRSQLFSDAVLGKLNAQEIEDIISQKRNKDRLLAYSLIPLDKGNNDALHRYEFIQRFIKESKQFGALRRDSEGKTAAIALENLARNAGFSDVTRFVWNMETERFDEIRSFLKSNDIDGISVSLNIDEEGKAEIVAIKNGNELKNIPSGLKENEYVKTLKNIVKSLKDQYSRARISLEKAMESEDVFLVEELKKLKNNPVIYPLIKNLVFKCGDDVGFFDVNGTVGVDGQVRPYQSDKIIVAHPVHLYESGLWSKFQRYVFENKLVQPFKQIFRELYKPNNDELSEKTISRRYAGHQIQPRKAAALLRSRGWTVSYEEGLQKVFYREEIVAVIYAMADWFSPAEVEAPAIEQVRFLNRKTGEFMSFEKIPAVVFSEVMRDVDLVVSVAHVGGVDPEASHSTVEMRFAIVSEILRLLKIENVKLKGSHAHIAGALGEYLVHLGSGVVHMQARGALNIIAVQSQHRGRIFLPFIDEDPKTAEVVSKILLLSEDKKTKDPLILNQIRE